MGLAVDAGSNAQAVIERKIVTGMARSRLILQAPAAAMVF
jgi:hypothetical protein